MAEKGLKAFEEALKADEALRQRYEEALKGVTEAANDGEAIQKAAAQLGYELSLEELEQAWASSQELDESELTAVAGGQDQYSDWCWVGWCCYTVVKHPDDIEDDNEKCTKDFKVNNHTEACWSDYNCVAWSN